MILRTAFDAEMTLIDEEGLNWLALRKHGPEVGQQVATITNGGMSGASFRESVAARLGIIGKISDDDWKALTDRYLETLAPGAVEAVRASHDAGSRVYMISGGFRQALLPLAEHLGIPRDHVHALDYDSRTELPREHALLENAGKAIVLGDIVHDDFYRYWGSGLDELRLKNFMVGDGMTDAKAKKVPFTMFMSVGDRPSVQAEADIVLKSLVDFPERLRQVLAGESTVKGASPKAE